LERAEREFGVLCIACGGKLDPSRALRCPHCGALGHGRCLREYAEIFGECPSCGGPLGIKDGELTGEGSGLISGPSVLGWWGAIAKKEKERWERVARVVWGGEVDWREARRRHYAYRFGLRALLGPLLDEEDE